MLRKPTLALLLCLTLSPSLLFAKQLAVVTDTANTTANLTTADLIKLFTAQTHSWADGKLVTIVMRDPTSSDMELVLRKVLNMTPAQARAFIQSHKAAVVVADSDDAVLRFVSSNHGAIGIVDLYSLTKGVTVIKIDGKLPVEQGYLLRGN
ncbi:MAG TPA: hypothetical protein VFA85_17575 [Terriglobales bacterium]|nr:hypothetical protein [Terriglobales bacterium]